MENGFSVLGLTFSPVKGPEGNIEYLIYLERSEAPSQGEQVLIQYSGAMTMSLPPQISAISITRNICC